MNEVSRKLEPNVASLNRRQWCLRAVAIGACSTGAMPRVSSANTRVEPKLVAGVVTAYAKNLHADVLLGKILEGWKQDGGPGRRCETGVDVCRSVFRSRHGQGHEQEIWSTHFDSIESALTLGGGHIQIDGVISIGEHGDYPWNENQQHMYPRRRFFEAITDTFAKYNRLCRCSTTNT